MRELVADDDSGFPRELAARLREHDLGAEELWLAWELSGYAPGLDAAERRALTRLLAALLVCVRQGSLRMPIGGPERTRWLDPLYRALGGSDEELARALALLPLRLGPLVGAPGDYRPLLVEHAPDGDWLYPERLRAGEDRLGAALRARLTAPPLGDAARAMTALDDVAARPARPGDREVALSAEQRRAVEAALSRRLTVISGGPGTGKTSIVASLLRALARLGLSGDQIALAAPTGKAAWRLREAILKSLESIADPAPADRALACPEARTLHRLLGYSPSTDRFRRHEHDRLAERVVIVDEASMIDLHLMDRLLRAVDPEARLILLGDADQLPSVEAGAVFRDLAPLPSAVRLTRSYRMDPADPSGRAVLKVAERVRRGEPDELVGDGDEQIRPRPTVAAVEFDRVELVEAPGALAAFCDRWWQERAEALTGEIAGRLFRRGPDGALGEDDRRELARWFDRFERFRILCVTRGEQPGGAAHVNELCRRLTARAARARPRGESDGELGPAAFYAGEPILVTRNDYERGLWNGDQGLVVRVSDGRRAPERMAAFPRPGGEPALFHLDALASSLQRAWAVTVHKSQGSEHDHVALILPDEDLPLLTRELVYTAITRSRRSVVIVGPRELLAEGVRRKIHRFSGLAARLRDLAPPSAPPSKPKQLSLF